MRNLDSESWNYLEVLLAPFFLKKENQLKKEKNKFEFVQQAGGFLSWNQWIVMHFNQVEPTLD